MLAPRSVIRLDVALEEVGGRLLRAQLGFEIGDELFLRGKLDFQEIELAKRLVAQLRDLAGVLLELLDLVASLFGVFARVVQVVGQPVEVTRLLIQSVLARRELRGLVRQLLLGED